MRTRRTGRGSLLARIEALEQLATPVRQKPIVILVSPDYGLAAIRYQDSHRWERQAEESEAAFYERAAEEARQLAPGAALILLHGES